MCACILGCRKDHVRHELQSLRRWPEEWSFLTREYCRVNKRLVGDRVTPDPDDEGIFCDSESGSASKHEENLPSGNGEQKTSKFEPCRTKITLPPIVNMDPSSVFPRTTSALIGWKSSKPAHQLEKYGRYAPNSRGQQGILKLLKWPSQGL